MKRCVIAIVLAHPKPLTGLYHHTAAPRWKHSLTAYGGPLLWWSPQSVCADVCVCKRTKIVCCHVRTCPCGWNSVLKPTARSLVSGRYRGTVERRPIPPSETMSNKEQTGFNRYTHTHTRSLSAHLLHCVRPCEMSKLQYRPIKKRQRTCLDSTRSSSQRWGTEQSAVTTTTAELSVVTVTSRAHSADLLLWSGIQITHKTLNVDKKYLKCCSF